MNRDATWTVRQAGRAAGVTRKAIRVYEARGLLSPTERTAAGYRLFSDTEVDTLRFIRRARSLGLGLDEIAEVLAERRDGGAPCASVRGRLAERVAEIDSSDLDRRPRVPGPVHDQGVATDRASRPAGVRRLPRAVRSHAARSPLPAWSRPGCFGVLGPDTAVRGQLPSSRDAGGLTHPVPTS